MNRELFSGIIREHHSPLMAYARMITGNAVSAGDVVQDSFVVAWQNISKFDVTRDIGAWLRGIVRNKWREACRHAGREITMDEESLAAIEEIVSEWQADRPEIFDHLAGCREQLPAPLAESINAYSCFFKAVASINDFIVICIDCSIGSVFKFLIWICGQEIKSCLEGTRQGEFFITAIKLTVHKF